MAVFTPDRSAAARASPEFDQVLRELRDLRDLFRTGFTEVLERLAKRTKSHLTVEEVGEATGRTPFTVRRWIKEGRLKAQRVSGAGPKGRLLIAREELDALVRAGTGANVPDAAIA